jgi:serine/threonine protein kinase
VKTLSECIYGKVYLVEGFLPNMPDTFAVKQLRRPDVLAGGQGLECGRNEIHAALALRDVDAPYTAKVFGAMQDENFFYILSEYCVHGELFSLLQRQNHIDDESVLREVMREILMALHELHEAGIAHRDVSLENVLVAADGTLRLIDFGQAVLVHPPGETAAEAPVPQSELGPPGKRNYRAPEVALGAPYLATKVDVFAVGVMLYTLVTGAYPFHTAEGGFLFPREELDTDRCRRLGKQLASLGISDRIAPSMLDFLEQVLAPNPDLRISAEDALSHPWITGTIDGLWLPQDTDVGNDEDEDEDEIIVIGKWAVPDDSDGCGTW